MAESSLPGDPTAGPNDPLAPGGERPRPATAPPPSFKPRKQFKDMDNLGFVMDVPVELRVEIGRRRTRIGDLLKLGAGSILELDKPSGEALDIYVNDRLIARGEAVVVAERYGVRLTEVLLGQEATADDDN
jgi:flagellar motor switch protein FliN